MTPAMAPPWPPGTARAGFNAALAQLESGRLRVDEDLVGLPLPEPFSAQPGAERQPGLVVAVFPLVGSRPDDPGLIYPARALARVAPGDGPAIRIIHPVDMPDMPADRALGAPTRLHPPSPAENRLMNRRWMALMEQAAPQLARPRGEDQALRDEMLALWRALVVPVLAPSYRLFAPRFHAWLGI